MLLVSGWSSARCSFTRMQLIISGVWMLHFTLKIVYIYLIKSQSARFLGGGGCYPLISAPVLCCIVNLTVRESGEIWVSLQSVIWNLWAISSVTKTNTWREAVQRSHNSQQNILALHHSNSYCFTSSLQCVNHDNYQDRHSWVRWDWNAHGEA